jgi:hypothetical protein
MGINDKNENRKHNIGVNVDSEPNTAILASPIKKKNIIINSQDSDDNNTDRGADEVKGFTTVHDNDSD